MLITTRLCDIILEEEQNNRHDKDIKKDNGNTYGKYIEKTGKRQEKDIKDIEKSKLHWNQ